MSVPRRGSLGNIVRLTGAESLAEQSRERRVLDIAAADPRDTDTYTVHTFADYTRVSAAVTVPWIGFVARVHWGSLVNATPVEFDIGRGSQLQIAGSAVRCDVFWDPAQPALTTPGEAGAQISLGQRPAFAYPLFRTLAISDTALLNTDPITFGPFAIPRYARMLARATGSIITGGGAVDATAVINWLDAGASVIAQDAIPMVDIAGVSVFSGDAAYDKPIPSGAEQVSVAIADFVEDPAPTLAFLRLVFELAL